MNQRGELILGLDLGQASDPSAAAVIQRAGPLPADFHGPVDARARCRSLRKWETGTDYNVVIDDVAAATWDTLVVDSGGPGRPVIDMLRKRCQGKRIIPVAITASGMRSHEVAGYWSVPKTDILTSLVLLQEQKLLTLPRGPMTQELLEELKQFRTNKGRKHETMDFDRSGMPGSHGDLTIAAALGAWWFLRGGRAPAIFMSTGSAESMGPAGLWRPVGRFGFR